MIQSHKRVVFLSVTAFGIAACATVTVVPPPKLSAAQPVDLVGSCTDIGARLRNVANTNITAVESIANGVMKIGGSPIDQHC